VGLDRFDADIKIIGNLLI